MTSWSKGFNFLNNNVTLLVIFKWIDWKSHNLVITFHISPVLRNVCCLNCSTECDLKFTMWMQLLSWLFSLRLLYLFERHWDKEMERHRETDRREGERKIDIFHLLFYFQNDSNETVPGSHSGLLGGWQRCKHLGHMHLGQSGFSSISSSLNLLCGIMQSSGFFFILFQDVS